MPSSSSSKTDLESLLVIKLDHVHIEGFRGIKSLDVDLKASNLVVTGPNGSGKSGVIDAVDFALTGRIRRLSGAGTGGLTVKRFGPHVDVAGDPEKAAVRLRVILEGSNKTATITRRVSAPNRPSIDPDDEAVRDALSDVSDHPEFTLSRREIVKFILVEPKNRALQIQSILNMEKVEISRANIAAAYNRLKRKSDSDQGKATDAQGKFLMHCGMSSFNRFEALNVINKKRLECGLGELSDLFSGESLRIGLATLDDSKNPNKKATLRQLNSVIEGLKKINDSGSAHATSVIDLLNQLESVPGLKDSLNNRLFLQQGIKRIGGNECPLCGVDWPTEDALRSHLLDELKRSREAESLEKALLDSARNLGSSASSAKAIVKSVSEVTRFVNESKEFSQQLGKWQSYLDEFSTSMESVASIIEFQERVKSEWLNIPAKFAENLAILIRAVESWPDQSDLLDAQTFLIEAQLFWTTYLSAEDQYQESSALEAAGRAMNEAYSAAIDQQLGALYEAVVSDFTSYYRQVNADDELGFAANLIPESGSVDFEVDFYGRGMYPPAAYHSEGHQDGMGVCLYLALMKHLYGERFSFALLDDVVMSVDASHRRQFCKLLKSEFKNTQFLITTHDRLWAQQLKSMRLVQGNSVLRFYGWSIESGPMVETDAQVWYRIEYHVARGEIAIAAAVLRNYLEFVYFYLADDLCAEVQFRSDGDYGLEDLCGPVIGRTMHWYRRATLAAESWNNAKAKNGAIQQRKALGKLVEKANVERWAINKALHFNAWANFEKTEFNSVAHAHRELLTAFECPSCKTWLYISTRNHPESLRCACNASNWNLNTNSNR